MDILNDPRAFQVAITLRNALVSSHGPLPVTLLVGAPQQAGDVLRRLADLFEGAMDEKEWSVACEKARQNMTGVLSRLTR